jgi:hypothetical protein
MQQFGVYLDFCSIICPDVEGKTMSLWNIMSKVRLEAFMWVSVLVEVFLLNIQN